ncbi:MAG: thymidine phosphorylase [Bacilli bacterium]|nr:thymidine phosphorylase [Bacilli bacterium]
MNLVDIILKKKNNNELSYDELSFFFLSFLNQEVFDYQMSSLLMAITINGLSINEVIALTDIFVKSGVVYKYNKKVSDKHSTGGIGDTTSFVIAPILASMNIPVAKMSGRGLGYTGGTIDKLESIPGFKTELTKEEFYNQVNKIGLVISSQTDDLVPLDKVIYALRDVTGTAESMGLIAASIMSKKIASGASYIVIDIKYGSGAFIKTKEEAKEFSKMLILIGKHFKKDIKTLINEMNAPLSSSIGNSLEVLEAIEVLKGKKCSLRDISINIAANIVSMAKKISLKDAKVFCENALDNKSAYKMFEKWIKTQGGDLSKIKVSDKVITLKSSLEGTIDAVSAINCGRLAMKLGAGRENKKSKIDYGVGIKLLKNIGDKAKKGEVLAELYVKNLNIKLTDEDLKIFSIK